MTASSMPAEWHQTTLGAVAHWGSGGTPSRKNPGYYGGNVPWVKTGDLGPKVLSAASEYITELGVKKSSAKYFPKGSVAIAMYGATIGRTSILGFDATTNQACAVGHPVNGITDTTFLYYLLRNEKDAFIAKGKGGAQPNISQALIKDHEVTLPPLAEQKVIADKLDTLLAQVENTQARLERIPKILKRFRQSVLAAAVSGRLTEEWSSTGVALREIAEFQNGYAFKSGWFENSGTYQVVKLGNIRDGQIALENSPAYVGDELAIEFSRYAPSSGDMLISMTGTRFKKDYGFGCMIKDEKNLLINQRVGRVIPDRSQVLPEFLSLFVRSDIFRDQFFDGETGGVNQGNVGSKHILSILVELPTMNVQEEIVRRVGQLFAHADLIEQQINNALARVNNLTQSILAKAFRGELTEQWRKDNPELIGGENSAEALLERIKAERAAVKPAKKAGKRKITA